MGKRVAGWVIGILAVGGLIAACVAAQRPNLSPDTRVDRVRGIYVLMETEAYEGDVGGVGISGKLTLLPGNCVGFENNELIVFPPGTEVSTDESGEVVIHVAGDDLNEPVDLRIGDRVDAGSRMGGAIPLSRFGDDLADKTPDACRKYRASSVDEFQVTG